MVYNTQNCWVSGLCPSSGILNTSKHNVSGSWSVSVLRCGERETPTWWGLLERVNLNHSTPERCFLLFWIPEDGRGPETQYFWHSVYVPSCCQRPSFTPTQNHWQNFTSVCSSFRVIRYQTQTNLGALSTHKRQWGTCADMWKNNRLRPTSRKKTRD
jgi:hypothetical protein